LSLVWVAGWDSEWGLCSRAPDLLQFRRPGIITTIALVASDPACRSSDQEDAYDGPVIAARGQGVGERWVWVTNSTRPRADVFRAPGPVAALRHHLLASLHVDDATADAFVDALRAEGWEDESNEQWDEDDGFEKLENAESVGEAAPVTALETTGVQVRVLGPVEVIGWTQRPDRAVVTELACYLALHQDRVIPGEELRVALWPDAAREMSGKSLRTYMSLLRKALGPENVPVGSGSGYRVGDGVSTDWLRFRELTGAGATAAQLREALELVRGRPFAGVPSTSFGWVFSELLVSEIEVGVIDAARRLAEELSGNGDLTGASWAVRQGLLAVPTDYRLWELQLAIGGRQGRGELARARRDAEAALGDDAVDLFTQVVGDEGN
jgi:DNA-binding SARP family transcriptional activator